MEKAQLTTIQITHETRDKLRALGAKGDTYEDVIKRLLNGKKG